MNQRQAAGCQRLEKSLAFHVGRELNSAASVFMDRVSCLRVYAAPSVFSLLVNGAHHKNLGVQLKPNQTWQKIISRVQKEKRSPFLSVIRLICAWNVSLKKVVCFGKAGFLSKISVPIMRGYPLLLWQSLWSVNSVGEKGIGILITSTCGPSAQLHPVLEKGQLERVFLTWPVYAYFGKGKEKVGIQRRK